jgi:hypothetical protein
MPRARLNTDRSTEYELVRVLEDGSYVLNVAGDHRVFEESGWREVVEVRCERCGRWSTDVAPGTHRWECFGGTCHRVGVDLASAAEGEGR